MRWTSLTRLALLVCLSSVALAQRPDQQGNRSRTLSSRQSDALLSTLPDIRTFRARGSDRFLVNLDTVRTGHPYKGKNARRPHTGGHVYFHVPKKAIPDGVNGGPKVRRGGVAAQKCATRVQEYPALRRESRVSFLWSDAA